MAVYKLFNKIQNYAWGSATAMSELLGYDNPENEPMAELWMGAHPKAPSRAAGDDPEKEIPLNDLIAAEPEEIIGPETSSRFDEKLPFLFKVLAAGSPLSIQAHPSIEQARKGFSGENAAGIAIDAFNRNYKDDNHKPEIICALTEYHAMRGFRPAGQIAANFRKIMVPELEAAAAALEAAAASPAGSPEAVDTAVSAALKNFFTVLMELKDPARERLLANAAKVLSENSSGLPGARWIKRFSELYPGDIGIVSPLYLNLIILQPGEAMYLPAGELHAYLEGLGMELMANSDNVLRGGLTPKHVDVPELLSTLTFAPCRPEILSPVKITEYESAYITPAPEFYLSRIELDGEYRLPDDNYGPKLPSIFICLDGTVEIADGDGSVKISRGETAFASFGSRLVLTGSGLLYRASVPA